MSALLPEAEARERVLARVAPLPAETVSLLEALGRFAATRMIATHALPGFDNSAMDGYAVGAAPLPAGTRLRVAGTQPAGADRALHVESGAAVRIFTGAPLPHGTAAVVMQEEVDRDGDEIVIREAVGPGEFIRRAGGDLARGQTLFEAGARLGPARLALLASQGVGEVAVGRRPRVAILATGDELRGPGEPLGPGEIYESNGTMLAALATGLGAIPVGLGGARDDRPALEAKLAAGLAAADALVIAGGVSVGERDLVKDALAAVGVEIDWWRVKVKPGKPFLFGTAPGGAPVFGLPGNPVSAFVTFLLFVRPALLRMMGAGAAEREMRAGIAAAGAELTNHGDRPHYQHGTVDAAGRFWPAGVQQSHALFGLSRGEGLVRVEAGQRARAGESVRVLYP